MLLNKLDICRSTRKFASRAFLETLKTLLSKNHPFSEKDLSDKWLSELRKNPQIFPDGWYIPPPHGMTVLFGTERDTQRVSPGVIRKEEYWPRDDIFLDLKNGIALVYASPVDRASGIIGDFGLAIYFGTNKRIQNHLKTCLNIDKKIFSSLKIGMKFSEINLFAYKLLIEIGLTSDAVSLSDPTGTNIGHTVPFSYEDMTIEERQILDSGVNDWEKTKDMIAKKRKFVNRSENLKITGSIAFTIEPRPYTKNDPEIPNVWIHTIALFKQNGEKELLTDFEEIFRLAKMDYMFSK